MIYMQQGFGTSKFYIIRYRWCNFIFRSEPVGFTRITQSVNINRTLEILVKNIPPLPDPEIEKTIPHLDDANESFARNFIWTFEDIRMLIGSNMPIFGDEEHPCVSLKLRDMRKPINVLTGMDYWLDNLMCQVNG